MSLNYRQQSNMKMIFGEQNIFQPKNHLKDLYAQQLRQQMEERSRREKELREQDETLKRLVIQADSPFGKDYQRQLMRINRELSKPVLQVQDFVQKNNALEQQRPKTRLAPSLPQPDPQYEKKLTELSQSSINNKIPISHPSPPLPIQQTTPAKNGSLQMLPPILTNRSFHQSLPPKTPGTVYDRQNQPSTSDYVSTYDQQHSHLLKQEKSNLVKELNQINLAYLTSLLNQKKNGSLPAFQPLLQPQLQPPAQQDFSANFSDSLDQELLKQQQLERQRQQEMQRQLDAERQRVLAEQEQRRKEEEDRQRKLREQVERELEEQRRLRQQEAEAQTQVEQQNTGTQHVDQNAVSASQYMNTLKTLSGSVIEMKNQFIQEQQKLNFELLQLREKTQRDIEEKQKIQKELRELEMRHKAFKVWEGEQQKQLMQAIQKNAPIPKRKEGDLNYKQINPTLRKVTRFRVSLGYTKDQTMGYEYDEPNQVLSKSNMVPLHNREQGSLHSLREEAPALPEELEAIRNDTVPQLNYSNAITRDLRIQDLNDKFYDYKYHRQMDQPGGEQQEARERPVEQKLDPNRVLLENDRRLYELSIIDPKGDQEQVQELYNYF